MYFANVSLRAIALACCNSINRFPKHLPPCGVVPANQNHKTPTARRDAHAEAGEGVVERTLPGTDRKSLNAAVCELHWGPFLATD